MSEIEKALDVVEHNNRIIVKRLGEIEKKVEIRNRAFERAITSLRSYDPGLAAHIVAQAQAEIDKVDG